VSLERDEELFPRTAAPLGWLVGAGAVARRAWLGRRGQRLDAPVISVGNLTVGGTGKTPVVQRVAEWLAGAGLHAAVLSRGYARPRPVAGVTRVSKCGRLEALRWELAGDEPWMLAQALAHASVYVAADRLAAGRAALADGAQVLLLDDGFQHLRLARDLDIVCLRGDEGRLRVLPAGPLREPPRALAAAHAAVRVSPWRGAEAEDAAGGGPGSEEARAARALERLRRRLGPEALWCEAELEPREVRLSDGQVLPPAALRGERVGLLCGIARHGRFVATVGALGARVEAIHARRDHHLFEAAELESLRQDLLWVTTEKDAVRLPREFGAAVLRVGLRFTREGEELRGRVLGAARPGPRAGGTG